jgi:hypothetical protein
VFVTSTETIVSPTTTTVTATVAGQPTTTTHTQTQTQTQTVPPSTVTATSIVDPQASTVTVTVLGAQTTSSQGASLGPTGSLNALSDTSLYFFSGVVFLIMAASLGILAFRRRVNEDYRKNVMSRQNEE